MDMECHYALVAQQLDGFTAKRQRQLLEYCQRYSAIFEADPSDYPTEAQPVIAGRPVAAKPMRLSRANF